MEIKRQISITSKLDPTYGQISNFYNWSYSIVGTFI